MPGSPPGPLRFADILTTANAVANYLGAGTVTAGHLLDAVAILQGQTSMDTLGRPLSPLARRPAGSATVDAAVRAVVQRWFAHLQNDANAALTPADLAALVTDLQAIVSPGG